MIHCIKNYKTGKNFEPQAQPQTEPQNEIS